MHCIIHTHGSKVLMQMLAVICQQEATRENMMQYGHIYKELRASLGLSGVVQPNNQSTIAM